MNTIDAYRQEIHMQVPYIRSAAFGGGGNTYLPDPARPDSTFTIFSGCGDSLVASMLAEYFSGGRSRAMDPSDIIRDARLAESALLYLVSVSGNTAATIRAARRCANPVAVTANPKSRLARAVGGRRRTIPLEFRHTGVTTAGSISFTASALRCISLACGDEPDRATVQPSAASRVFERARRDAAATITTDAAATGTGRMGGSLYILGNLLTYPLAMYAAAKFYEVLGYDARYARIEQFFHMELFSARRGDTVLMFEEPGSRSGRMAGALGEAGINVANPCGIPKRSGLHGPLLQVLYCAFYSQLLTLGMADALGLAECHFVTARDLRSASNAVIY